MGIAGIGGSSLPCGHFLLTTGCAYCMQLFHSQNNAARISLASLGLPTTVIIDPKTFANKKRILLLLE